jgi:hypothetical protein
MPPPRRSLGLISPNRVQKKPKKELTPMKRAEITGAAKSGVPNFMIADALHEDSSTISKTIKKAEIRNEQHFYGMTCHYKSQFLHLYDITTAQLHYGTQAGWYLAYFNECPTRSGTRRQFDHDKNTRHDILINSLQPKSYCFNNAALICAFPGVFRYP